jgi:hypothetical protein
MSPVLYGVIWRGNKNNSYVEQLCRLEQDGNFGVDYRGNPRFAIKVDAPPSVLQGLDNNVHAWNATVNTVLFHSIRQSRDFRLPPENPINREKIIAGVKKIRCDA